MRENKNKVTNSEVNELEEAELVNSDGITMMQHWMRQEKMIQMLT